MSDDPSLRKPYRLILQLGKFRVLERQNLSMKLELGGSTTMTVTLPPNAEVRTGDILTLYTEVLFKHVEPEQKPTG